MRNIKINQKGNRLTRLVLCAALALLFAMSVFTVSFSATDGEAELRLIPGGIPFGVKFSTEGVVVVGFCDLNGTAKSQNPAYAAGLRPKDVIVKIDGRPITDAAELTRLVESSGGREISLTYLRSGAERTARLSPVFSKADGKYKTGMWVRDSGAGIGTVTYIDPSTCCFGGLGHGICDGDTGELIPMHRGVVMDVTISAIKKGVSGAPGEIKGYFGTSKKGSLYGNTECGVYGMFSELPKELGEAIPVGKHDEVRCGEAYILCTLENGARQRYEIEISSVNREAKGSKCFLIKITDPKLIEKTGGIVQGMSGSPIIQNGKLVGAVTHVLINDPTTGYGIFIENMLAAAEVPQQRAA